MAVAPTRMQALSMYRSLMREANKLQSYNFRSYALRRIRDAFTENKNITEPKQVQKLYDYAKENLEIIRRQAVIQHMYQAEKIVVENRKVA